MLYIALILCLLALDPIVEELGDWVLVILAGGVLSLLMSENTPSQRSMPMDLARSTKRLMAAGVALLALLAITQSPWQ